MYDLAADYFSEGKRRYVSKDGKVGFADRAGNLVTPAQHDWAGQFEYGYAEFCDGCREVRVDEEHTAVQGGTWGMMDARGNTVAPGRQHSPHRFRHRTERQILSAPVCLHRRRTRYFATHQPLQKPDCRTGSSFLFAIQNRRRTRGLPL